MNGLPPSPIWPVAFTMPGANIYEMAKMNPIINGPWPVWLVRGIFLSAFAASLCLALRSTAANRIVLSAQESADFERYRLVAEMGCRILQSNIDLNPKILQIDPGMTVLWDTVTMTNVSTRQPFKPEIRGGLVLWEKSDSVTNNELCFLNTPYALRPSDTNSTVTVIVRWQKALNYRGHYTPTFGSGPRTPAHQEQSLLAVIYLPAGTNFMLTAHVESAPPFLTGGIEPAPIGGSRRVDFKFDFSVWGHAFASQEIYRRARDSILSGKAPQVYAACQEMVGQWVRNPFYRPSKSRTLSNQHYEFGRIPKTRDWDSMIPSSLKELNPIQIEVFADKVTLGFRAARVTVLLGHPYPNLNVDSDIVKNHFKFENFYKDWTFNR